jgi:hypothetical protein
MLIALSHATTLSFLCRVQKWARKHNDMHIEDVSVEGAKRGGRPVLVKSYKKYFRSYSLDLTGSKYGVGMVQDISKSQNIVITALRKIEEDVFMNRPYLLSLHYVCEIVKGASFSETGEPMAVEKQKATIRSDAHHKMESVFPLKPKSLSNAVAMCNQRIVQNFNSSNYEGSDWTFGKSIAMIINVAKKLSGLHENASDSDVEKALELDESSDDGGATLMGPEKEVEQAAGHHIPLPKWVHKKQFAKGTFERCAFNPKARGVEDDNKCFQWCILRERWPDGHPDFPRTAQKYKQEGAARSNVSDLIDALHAQKIDPIVLPEGMTYPIKLDDETFKALEKINRISFSVFLIGGTKGQVTPYYVSKNRADNIPHYRLGLLHGFAKWLKAEQQINLGKRVKDGEGVVHHFILLKDFSILLGKKKMRRKVKSGEKEDGRHIRIHNREEEECENTFYCENCICRFGSTRTLKIHEERCLFDKPVPLKLPELNDRWLKFKKFSHLQPQFCAFYCDTEAVNQPDKNDFDPYQLLSSQMPPVAPEGEKDPAFNPTPPTEPGVIYNHEPCNWSYRIVFLEKYRAKFDCMLGYEGQPFNRIRSYVGPDAMSKFFDSILFDATIIKQLYRDAHRPDDDDPTEETFDDAALAAERISNKNCCLCRTAMPAQDKEPFFDGFTGEYMGLAHAKCRRAVLLPGKYAVPVVMHNFRGYDAYHILQGSANYHTPLKTTVLAKSMESFITMNINNVVRFIDSYQFQKGSLDNLVNNLRSEIPGPDQDGVYPDDWMANFRKVFAITSEWHDQLMAEIGGPEPTPELFETLCKKGIYPYELPQNVTELFNCTEFPNRRAFSSRLRGKGISVLEHMRAQFMWNLWKCKHLARYSDLYCQLDVVLLADVMEFFRKTCLAEGCDGLDPLHYLTAPGMAYQALLFKNYQNGVVVELVSDGTVGIEGLRMAEKGTRGGLCQVQDPYSKAVHVPSAPTLPLREMVGSRWDDDFRTLKSRLAPGPERKIIYIDANNLYGTAMEKWKMPHKNFVWLKTGERALLTHSELESLLAIEEEASDFLDINNDIRQTMAQRAIWYSECMEDIENYILNINLQGECGYLLEVDLEYPEEVRRRHNDLPFCPENKLAPPNAPWLMKHFEDNDVKNAFTTKRLIADLNDKKVGSPSQFAFPSGGGVCAGSPLLGDAPTAGSRSVAGRE